MRKEPSLMLKELKEILENKLKIHFKKDCQIWQSFLLLSKKFMYKILAKINKLILPSFTKQRLDMAKAKKWQLVIIGWKYYVTKRALDN